MLMMHSEHVAEYVEHIPIEHVIRVLYAGLQARVIHPPGVFDSDGRFYLTEFRAECCNRIQSPSRLYPYSEMVHGRTKKHLRQVATTSHGRGILSSLYIDLRMSMIRLIDSRNCITACYLVPEENRPAEDPGDYIVVRVYDRSGPALLLLRRRGARGQFVCRNVPICMFYATML
jgi:hypothetical protein